MGFQQAVTTCLTKYADFRGRASRSEYWYFFLAIVLASMAVGIVCVALGKAALYAGVGLVALAIFLPSLAAQVWRLHDTNASGWWVLIGFVPYVGGLIMLVWYCIKGTAGDNRFGPDPLNPHTVEAFD